MTFPPLPTQNRWVDYISSLHPNYAIDVIVEATDSDYIMIAMLHYEKQCQFVERDGAGLGRVSLRRIKCHGKEHAAGESRGGDNKKKKREMEYVHVPLLCEVMSSLVRELFDGVGTPMQCLTAIVALGGTDFCRNIPRIGAHRMWELLPLALRTNEKIQIFKQVSSNLMLLDEDAMCDVVITGLYSQVYSNHLKNWKRPRIKTFESLSDHLKKKECKLSQNIKNEFPNQYTMGTIIRNVSWNVLYWLASVEGNMQLCPSPIHPMYGYGIDSESGKAQWLDVLLLQSALSPPSENGKKIKQEK